MPEDSKKLPKDSFGNPVPPNIYHYTDSQGLMGIFNKNELWLSRREFMNDINDEEYVRSLIEEKLRPRYEGSTFYGSMVQQDLVNQGGYQYVFSTSTEKDSIHPWTYYGSSDAYCIEFETEKLIDFFKNWDIEKQDRMLSEKKAVEFDKESFHFGKVIYDSENAKETLHKGMEEMEQSILDMVDSPANMPPTSDYRDAGISYKTIYSLIKQEGHSCEKEFRFVIQTKDIVPEFRVRNGLFIPYIKFARMDSTSKKNMSLSCCDSGFCCRWMDSNTKKNIPLPIKSVSIGPTNHDSLAEKGLKLFFEKIGVNIPVERSKLNMRI